MGRKHSNVPKGRTAIIQFRCTPAYRARLFELVGKAGYPDLTAMIEAMIEKERQRAGDEPFPPR